MPPKRPQHSPKKQPKKQQKSAIKQFVTSIKSTTKWTVDLLKNERTHFVIGVFVFLFVIFLFISFVSYFFTGAADKSIFDNSSFREALGFRGETKNWLSVIGATFAELLIDGWFGIASFALLPIATVVSFRLMGNKLASLLRTALHCLFWLIWGSVFLSFISDLLPILRPSFFALGGKHGNLIANHWLSSFIGKIGTFLVLIFTLVSYFVLFWSGAIDVIKSLFTKKEKMKKAAHKAPAKAPQVAVGTEIIPEEWIDDDSTEQTDEWEKLKKIDETEETDKAEDVEEQSTVPTEKKSDEVAFEVTSPTNSSTMPVPVEKEEAPATNYNLEQLGKYDPTLDLSSYQAPTSSLLKVYNSDHGVHVDMAEQNSNKERIITTLKNFGIDIESIKATVGPTITLYEIVPKSGIRISKIRNLESDIMLSLAATGIRIIAPIPGKGTIGIEVPNNDPQIVSMNSVITSEKFQKSKFKLPVVFGRTITNEEFMIDLVKMPHLLVAGATGQGKSVGLNAIITSLLYKKHPAELKFVLIDPKKVEFNIYAAVEKHFLAKLPDGEDAIITDTSKVVETLNSLTIEMDARYDLLKKAHVRIINEYNEKFTNRQLNPEKGHRYLPYIVVVIDEFGDLIMTAGKEIEMPIARIAQLARAVGIHMIIATQRPSVNIITGMIKANFPARVAFRVTSMIDSKTILDTSGANQLVGRGDMLFSQGNDLTRVQCAFVDTPEVEAITNFIGDQRGYPTAFYLPEYVNPDGEGLDSKSVDMTKKDALFAEAARLLVATQQGSTSMIQRKLSIGYARAGRITDQLEVAGIVGPAEGSKTRQVLVATEFELEQLLAQLDAK